MKQAEERKQFILEKLNRENRIYVSELSQIFDVSEVTIRKDLQELEARGLLRRMHGGAATMEKSAVEPTLDVLAEIHVAEKKKIAQSAYQFISDGDSLLLDASTTVRELVSLIRDGARKDLTIITTAIEVSRELAPCEHVQVIQMGGLVRRSLVTVMGPLTTANLAGLHADKAFIGVNGVDPQHGLTTQHMLECEVKKNMIEASTQSFVLADSSKMRSVALGVICPTGRVDFIITDGGVPTAFVEALEGSGVEVVVAD